MSDPYGAGGPSEPASPGGSLGPGAGYPEYSTRFDPTKPLTGPNGQYGPQRRPGQQGPWQQGPGQQGPGQPTPPPPPRPNRPRGSRGPLLITLAVVALVVIVVGAATLYAHVKDAGVRAATASPGVSTAPNTAPASSSAAQPTGEATTTTFTTDDGTGTITIVAHDWRTTGDPPPANGNYLELEIEMAATEGTITVEPSRFQAFDAEGNLFQSGSASSHQPLLTDTTLAQGEKTTGWLSYDIDRSDTTVLLGDELGQPVAALKVKGR